MHHDICVYIPQINPFCTDGFASKVQRNAFSPKSFDQGPTRRGTLYIYVYIYLFIYI